ncbi:hypothetical protein PVAND_016052 [Polypedilum vanderplanki]|uniref:Adhesin domain-containing protein n=1 Tax=Polypedilum vanderplanki TaxID=319348 RepID=A0A9J6BEH3_POLVA|nr:hypothetical protein PVAND_016052 [Polypedilum vanderplanki]
MLQLKRVLTSNIFKDIYRSYVSFININADKVKIIKVRQDEYEDYENKIVKVEMIDGDNNIMKIDKNIAEITQNDKKFNLECHETKEDTTVIVELPISQCNDIEIKISAVKGDIKVDNIPHAKKISLNTNGGKVKLMHLRSGEINAIGTNIFMDTVYAYSVDAKAKGDEEKSLINISGCQSDNIKLDGPKIKIDSCYANNVDIKSTQEALLKNLHGNCKFNCSGKVFNTVGFTGTFDGKLNTERNMLHFAEISGDNKVEIIHPASYVRAGFANEIVKESTNLHIISNCLIATKSREFIVCQKAEDKYEVIRNNPDSDSTLKMIVTSGKEFQLIKQSWIDSIRFEI